MALIDELHEDNQRDKQNQLKVLNHKEIRKVQDFLRMYNLLVIFKSLSRIDRELRV